MWLGYFGALLEQGGPRPNVTVSSQMRNSDPDTHRCQDGDGDAEMLLEAKEPPDAGGEAGQTPPQGLRRNPPVEAVISAFRAPDSETIHFCCLNSPTCGICYGHPGKPICLHTFLGLNLSVIEFMKGLEEPNLLWIWKYPWR